MAIFILAETDRVLGKDASFNEGEKSETMVVVNGQGGRRQRRVGMQQLTLRTDQPRAQER